MDIKIIISSRRPSARLGCLKTTHNFRRLRSSLIIRLGCSIIPIQVIRKITVAPTIILVEGGVYASSTFVSCLTIIKLLCDQSEFRHWRHKFCCNTSQLLQQPLIFGGEFVNRGTIASSGGCKIRNCINGFDVLLFLGGRWSWYNMKPGGRGGIYVAFSVLLKSMGQVQFELRPCFYGAGRRFQMQHSLTKMIDWKTSWYSALIFLMGVYGTPPASAKSIASWIWQNRPSMGGWYRISPLFCYHFWRGWL